MLAAWSKNLGEASSLRGLVLCRDSSGLSFITFFATEVWEAGLSLGVFCIVHRILVSMKPRRVLVVSVSSAYSVSHSDAGEALGGYTINARLSLFHFNGHKLLPYCTGRGYLYKDYMFQVPRCIALDRKSVV